MSDWVPLFLGPWFSPLVLFCLKKLFPGFPLPQCCLFKIKRSFFSDTQDFAMNGFWYFLSIIYMSWFCMHTVLKKGCYYNTFVQTKRNIFSSMILRMAVKWSIPLGIPGAFQYHKILRLCIRCVFVLILFGY